jgi:DNA-binding GntR family transcriptional regulator
MLSLLLTFQFRSRQAYPGESTLARNLGVSLSTARRHIVSLEKKGFIVREFRPGHTTVYNTNPTMAKLQAHDCPQSSQKRTHSPSKNEQAVPPEVNTKEYPPRRKFNKSAETVGSVAAKQYRVLLRNRS